MKIEAVLFDADGVILDSLDGAYWGQNRAVEILEKTERQGFLPKSAEELREFWRTHQRYREGVEALWPGIDFSRYIELYYRDVFPKEEVSFFPDVIEVLAWLREQALFLGIVTSRDRKSFNLKSKKAGLPLDLFDYIQTSEDYKACKPEPEVFDKVLALLRSQDITPDKVVYVGDSTDDFYATRLKPVPINFVGVLTGIATREDFLEAGVPEKCLVESIGGVIPHSLHS
ncbi:HAD family hydrolase [Patescibacteria group bacterium]|nr:HAD family hydrolase [Patescibacteria group bacterium]MBU4512229.1 HAD family hydrolase [Patescibacteria group bacterium]MCG2692647.1 HAD family hydrolase [Candidatus Parcubacteria bacterium]